MPRTLQIAGSFAIVLVVFWAYALVAVPLIEPTLDPAERGRVSEEALEAARGHADRWVAELAAFFPPGSWERDNPVILEGDQVTLLVGKYTPLPGGEVELKPCTLIFTPGGPDAPPAQRREKAILVQAAEGAVVQFDKPLDLGRARIGEPVGGRLDGPITIHGAGKPDDPSDDLVITTRDVQLTKEHIWTAQPVRFRLGPHSGEGREMHIRLLPAEESGSRRRGRGPSIGGLGSFELVHLDRLHLEIVGEDMSPRMKSRPQPGAKQPAVAQGLPPLEAAPSAEATPASAVAPPLEAMPPGAKPEAKPITPVEIACRGPFVFNAVKQTASFEDRVSVIRLYPKGPNDRLDCDVLTVYFAPRRTNRAEAEDASPEADEDEASDRKKPSRLLDLEPRQLVAQGSPAVILSPREDVEARGERLEYDLVAGRILVDGRQPVFLRKGHDTIETARVQYQPSDDPRQLGQLVAKGPGRLVGQLSDKPGQQVEARWNEDLLVQPDEQNQVISLTGDAELVYAGIGRLSAGEIHFFLIESPKGGKDDRFDLQPDRMRADGNVRLDSPQVSGSFDRLEVWFARDESAPGGYRPRIESSGKGAAPPGAPPGPLEPAAAPGGAGIEQPDASELPKQHFQLTGGLLQAQLVLGGSRPELSSLIVADHVEMIETQTGNPVEKPMIARGDRIEVGGASTPHAWVKMDGQPAYFAAQGLGLSGASINVNRGTNRLWSTGPGFMDLPPLGRDLQGRPLKSTGPMRVTWQKGMTFDGLTITFEGSVVAASEFQRLLTESLEVSLRERVSFADVKGRVSPDRPPDVQEIRCAGGVRMDSRTLEAGRPQSIESLEVPNLAINNASGDLRAQGPGWVTSVRLGKAGPAMVPGFPGPQTPPAASAAPNGAEEQLTYLHVRFQDSITGDVRAGRQSLAFHGQVRATYGPVETWQDTLPDDDPDALGPQGAQLDCDHLSVVEMPSPVEDRQSFELRATGNTTVRGRDFTARGARMTYDQHKGMLIFEGDGRSDAFLSYQKYVGAKADELFAQRIEYWPETHQSTVLGPRSLEVSFPKEPYR